MNGKIAVLLLALLGAAFYLQSTSVETLSMPSERILQFQQWKQDFGKFYTTFEEEQFRMQIFYEKVVEIEKVNAEQNEYQLGLNQFSDLTEREFIDTYLGYNANEAEVDQSNVDNNLPNAANDIDWRTAGAVNAIKDQGSCGSCWAFSTNGALEGLSKIKGTSLENFSEQQLVDCSRSYGNQGCNGGLMDNAFKYVRDKGIQHEDEYPYTAKDGACKKDSGAYKISGFTNVGRGQVSALQQAITQQPTSVAVDASKWSAYKSGIFSGCGTALNHGVTGVGYTPEYWIIRNSWGTKWGEEGYMRLKMGNTCGVANQASWPKK